MPATDALIWIVLAGTVVVCVLSMFGVFASIMRHETSLHDLRNRVAELQYSYTLQLARLHGHIGPEEGEVDIVGEDGEVIEAVEIVPDAPVAAEPPRAAA